MADRIETQCIHLYREEERREQERTYGAISIPIFQTATFAHPDLGKTTGYDYTRQTNPTRNYLEKLVAQLEQGSDCAAFTSGMAAISALMEIFSPGDHLIVEEDLYGGSIRLFERISQKNGIEFTRLNIAEDNVEPHITDHTKAVFIETPTNPMMHVTDIEALAKTCKKHELLLIVDNTFLSPYLQNPISLGADIVVHSGTKYMGGHNDTLSGFLVAATPELGEKIHFMAKCLGAALDPFDSWMIIRGIKTLAVRMERACENAMKIAEWLKRQEKVTDVFYPGLIDHPGYAIVKKQARGFGAMISFNMRTKEQAVNLLKEVQLIQFAESLGGTESLLTYPITQTHSEVPEELRLKNGLTDRLLRLSVGIENADDMIQDLDCAMKKV